MATVLDKFLPMKVSGVRPGLGSLFTVDLTSSAGEKRCLWVYLCGWALLGEADRVVYSDSAKEEIDEFLSRHWKPDQLVSTGLNEKLEIDFCFDNSRLRLFPYPETYGADADIFRFFEDDRVHYLRYEDRIIKEEPRDRMRQGRVEADH